MSQVIREAISYGRFSTGKQGDEGRDSEPRQREAYEAICRRYADRLKPSERFGFGVLFGRGEGAHLAEGGSLKTFLDLLKSREIDPNRSALCIESWSRFSRIPPDLAVKILSDIVRSGCPVAVHRPSMFVTTAELSSHEFVIITNELQRAHEQSAEKVDYLTKAFSRKKREARESHRAFRGRGPAWLVRRVPGARDLRPWTEKDVIPSARVRIRRVFTMAAGGLGAGAIAQIFNREGVPVVAEHADKWSMSVVLHLLKNRAVLGWYQPLLMVNGKRTPDGPPIPDYFPQVIEPELFWRAAGALTARNTPGSRAAGRTGRVNLFQNLLRDGRTGSRMKICPKGKESAPYLVPQAAANSQAPWSSFPLEEFEFWFVLLLSELKPQDLFHHPEKRDIRAELAGVRGEIDSFRRGIEELETAQQLPAGERISEYTAGRLIDGKRAAIDRLTAKERELEALAVKDDTATLTELQELTALVIPEQVRQRLDSVRLHPDDVVMEAYLVMSADKDFRLKLQGCIRQLVKSMWMVVSKAPGRRYHKTADVQIWFHNGGWRYYRLELTPKGCRPVESGRADDKMEQPGLPLWHYWLTKKPDGMSDEQWRIISDEGYREAIAFVHGIDYKPCR